jgi:3-deoxy-D-arabino-heptulosonate 7-phosphate (DAHP) synthase
MSTSTEETVTVSDERMVTVEDALKGLQESKNARLQTQLSENVVNPIELAKHLEVKPQMVYNYIRSGRIPSRLNDTQHFVVSVEDACEFISLYLSKKAAKAAQVEAELNGE